MLTGDCNVCVNGKMPSYSATCVECGLSRKNYKPITNADRIRAMTDEELADKFIFGAATYACPPNEAIKGSCTEGKDCRKCWLSWLKSPAEDEA